MSRRPSRGSRRSAPIAAEPLSPPPVDPAVFAPLDDSWVDALDEDQRDEVVGLGDVPATVPEPAAIHVRPITDADLDRLWDWIRTEEDRAAAFFGGTSIRSARELYGYFAALPASSLAQAITAPEHIGFVVLHPVRPEINEAGVSIYLAPEVRGRLPEIIPGLLRQCDAAHGYTLVQVITDPVRVRLWEPFGFEVTYVLRRTPKG